ncbi:unnamed protein product [Gordionus sp. m RMFG-2023]|uniref:F-box/WD repeat-containing protein 11-like n=1 Tax=Gordionus sp. m RMFG-2023 TaxID=3053472 RepID=UPI0030E131CA
MAEKPPVTMMDTTESQPVHVKNSINPNINDNQSTINDHSSYLIRTGDIANSKLSTPPRHPLSLMSSLPPLSFNECYHKEREEYLKRFEGWNQPDQVDFVQHLLHKMCHYQHGLIDSFLKPMLQRDFLSLLPKFYLDHLAEKILSYVDARSLASCEAVCKRWNRVVCQGVLWKKLMEKKVKNDPLWKGLSTRRGWSQFLYKAQSLDFVLDQLRSLKPLDSASHTRAPFDSPFYEYFLNGNLADAGQDNINSLTGNVNILNEKCLHSNSPPEPPPYFFKPPGFMQGDEYQLKIASWFYKRLFGSVLKDITNLESNWREGRHSLRRIKCRSENSKGVYCLQYDESKIVSGLRDNTIKIWDFKTLECIKVLTGHTGSVLCLQYDDKIIITGSSDATVRIWDVSTGEMLNTLIHHCEAVLHLRFEDEVMVTCSKDRSIAVWDMRSPKDISLRRVLVGHRAAVNVVDFDSKYIVSASGDRTIKVWDTSTCEFVRTLNGHKRGIACLQYRDRLIVSGSSDYTIRLWDIECGSCLRILEGHEELVRCIRFDNKRIVSGAYDGKIKVWDLAAALDPRTPSGSVCIRTLVEHTGRVFRLQFDEFQIVSSSHDDTILIWDFLNYENQTEPLGGLSTLANPLEDEFLNLGNPDIAMSTGVLLANNDMNNMVEGSGSSSTNLGNFNTPSNIINGSNSIQNNNINNSGVYNEADNVDNGI